ncbi:hypothetical protein LEMLEM_LOCUS16734, partial [Lemmus lemmus]
MASRQGRWTSQLSGFEGCRQLHLRTDRVLTGLPAAHTGVSRGKKRTSCWEEAERQ